MLALAAVAAVGWIAWQELWTRGGDAPLAWRDLTDRALAAPPRSQLSAFRDRGALLDALGPSATAPPIDFEHRDAVLVSAGPRSSSAYALDLVGVTEERRRIVVSVRERAPTLRRPGAAALTFPFRLFTIERADKALELDWIGRP